MLPSMIDQIRAASAYDRATRQPEQQEKPRRYTYQPSAQTIRKVLEMLKPNEPITVPQIAGWLGIGRSSASMALWVLRDRGHCDWLPKRLARGEKQWVLKI